MSDGESLFSAAHANDLGSSKPLNEKNLGLAWDKMVSQTGSDGEPANIYPRNLVVHPLYKRHAIKLVESSKLIVDMQKTSTSSDSTFAGDANPWNGELQVVSDPQLAAGSVANSIWYLTADPNIAPCGEMGFLGGKSEPECFIQEPNGDSEFKFETRLSKCRLIMGGTWKNYRTIVRANV